MSDIFGKFYSPAKALSYGRPYIFSVGARSIGKSTGWAIKLLQEFLKSGKKWIYVRRTEDELKLSVKHFFDNAAQIVTEYTGEPVRVEYRGSEGYFVNDEQAGYAVPLSRQGKYKSATEFSGVHYILYDEFLMSPGSTRYLQGAGGMYEEVDCMTFLYQTVDRAIGKASRNETTVIFLGNAGQIYNPFFMFYGVDRLLRPETVYLAPRGKLWVCEQTSETEATADIKQSYAYQLSRPETAEYAYNNQYADIIRSDFIQKKAPSGSWEPLCNINMDGKKYGVYMFERDGIIYVCHRACPGRLEFAITTDDHRPNYLLIRRFSEHSFCRTLQRMYNLGAVRYEDQKCKYVIDFFFGHVV